MSSRLSAGLRRLLAKHTPALLGMQSTVWGDSHMLPSRGVRVWVVYLTPKIERVISLLSASLVGEARCRCRKVWLTRIDYLLLLSNYQINLIRTASGRSACAATAACSTWGNAFRCGCCFHETSKLLAAPLPGHSVTLALHRTQHRYSRQDSPAR
jgi:hypothetical protein